MSEGFLVPGWLAAGSWVAGYRLEEPVGVGGMAVVYRARDERLGRLVALKVLAPALAADEEFRRRFTAESRAAAAVDHPHIIPVHEAGQAGRVLFIAMRFVPGDLRQVLAREGPLPPERAAQLLSPVASALDAAHRAGLVHRDVKPANILVDTHPDRPDHVYLSDFGISKGAASAAGLTGTGQYLGTPEYTSPEQVNGQAVDGRADQYALACVAWHLFTGTVPFQRDQGLAVLLAHLREPPPLHALVPRLPAAAGQVLARALGKEPGERYPSCGEFVDALRQALALPPYRPIVPVRAAVAAAGLPGTGVPAPPVHPATVGTSTAPADPAGAPAAGEGSAPMAAGVPGVPVATAGEPGGLAAGPGMSLVADGPTQDITSPRPRIQPGPGPGGGPGRRRRYIAIALAATLLAAAAVTIPLLRATPAAPQPSAGPHVGTPASTATATGKKMQPATQPAAQSGLFTGTLTATLDVGGTGVNSVAFSPDGTIVAVGDQNGDAYLWNAATGKPTAILNNPNPDPNPNYVNAVAFSPAGTILATGDRNGTYLWDIATGKVTATFTDPDSQVVNGDPGRGAQSVAFAPGGTMLATGDWNGHVYLWDIATGKLTATLRDPAGFNVTAVAFGSSDATLATADGGGTAYLWDAATGKLTATLPGPGAFVVTAVAFSPDGTALATSDLYGRTYVWDTATGKRIHTLADPGGAGAVAFGPDDTTIATGDTNGRAYLWDTKTGKHSAAIPGAHSYTVLAFSRDGTTLAVGDKNGDATLWHISKHNP